MEHLAFGDAEDLESQQFSSCPEGHIPSRTWVFAHRCDSQQLSGPELCLHQGALTSSPACSICKGNQGFLSWLGEQHGAQSWAKCPSHHALEGRSGKGEQQEELAAVELLKQVLFTQIYIITLAGP